MLTPRRISQVSTLALLGALGSLGFSISASAAVLCGSQTNTLRTSEVLSNTFNNGDGTFSYNFTVCNTSSTTEYGGPFIVDWEVPYDPSVGIILESITSPEGWSYAIETIGSPNAATGWNGIAAWQIPNNPDDPLNMYGAFPAFRSHTQVLHWFTCQETSGGCNDIDPGDSLPDFGFLAPIGPVAGPYQASWADREIRAGDPDLPGGFGIPFRTTSVPEPSGLALFALGLGAFMAARRRKDDKQT